MGKYSYLFLFCFGIISSLYSQETIQVYRANGAVLEENIGSLEEILLHDNLSVFNWNSSSTEIPFSDIDSITFHSGDDLASRQIVHIVYNKDNVAVINPYASAGIYFSTNGRHVTVISEHQSDYIEYRLSGTSDNASFSVNSVKPVLLTCNNLHLVNPSGAAIAVTKGVQTSINLLGNNTLSDGVGSSGNGTIRTQGDLLIGGTGNLSITSLAKHAISSGGTITVESGTITVGGTVTDGFHSEGFVMKGGSLDISAGSDAIDAGGGKAEIQGGKIRITSTAADVKGIKSDELVAVSGGSVIMTIAGAQSKGISSKKEILFNGGEVEIVTSGSAVLEVSGSGYDPSYCTAVKADGGITVDGGTLTIENKSTNMGGKGLSADGDIVINNGTLKITTAGNGATYTNSSGSKDSYTSCCIKSDANISILGGNITCSSSGTGGKGISADKTITIGRQGASDDNLLLKVSTSGERFLVSGSTGGGRPGGPGGGDNADYANPKAIKSIGNLTVNSGTITISCTQNSEGGEGLESKSTLTVNGGTTVVSTYDDSLNASNHIAINGGTHHWSSTGNDCVDSNGTITITGGFVIAKGARSPESAFDCDNHTFSLSGGLIIGTGGEGNGMGATPTASASSQRSIFYKGTAGNSICIKKSSGEILLLYKMPTYTGNSGMGGGNSMALLFSDPAIITGSYTLQYGGTISGGTTVDGYTTGGTYSGGSSKSFTVSSMVTTVQ